MAVVEQNGAMIRIADAARSELAWLAMGGALESAALRGMKVPGGIAIESFGDYEIRAVLHPRCRTAANDT